MPAIERPGGIELQCRDRGEGPIVMLAPYWSINTVLAFGAGPFALRDFEGSQS